MTRTSSSIVLAVAGGLIGLGAPAWPQSQPSAADIGAAFDRQIEFKQSQSGCPAGQKCRGLVVPSAAAPTARGLAVIPGKVDDDGAAVAGDDVTMMVDYFSVPEDIQINVRIAFDFDSAALRQDQQSLLADMCIAMQGSQAAQFHVIGHTDAVGTDEYNMRLSLLRAEEVRRYLIFDCGIAPNRLKSVGMGETVLLRPDSPRADENRRVEFQALG